MPAEDGAIAVRLHGAWQDRALDYDATIALHQRVISVAFDPNSTSRQFDIALDQLAGAAMRDGHLELALRNGTRVVVSGSPYLDGFRNRLEAAVSAFPAQTLSLRHFGSERSAPGSDHDRWFEALLTARRVAEESRSIETQRRAFDAHRLQRHAQQVRDAWAVDRFTDAASRRALVAELEDACEPYTLALSALESQALALRHSDETRQFESWREWTDLVQRAFRGADDVWAACVPILADSRGASGALWRRVLNRQRAGERSKP
jgi:hypothetical protein